jgi:hypothetical protein
MAIYWATCAVISPVVLRGCETGYLCLTDKYTGGVTEQRVKDLLQEK